MPSLTKRGGYPLHQSPFYCLRSKKRLAEILGISTSALNGLAKSANSSYSEFDVEKKNGGTRRVENPARPLKLIQAKIARMLGRVRPPDYLFCPVKGRCYISNAARHANNRVVRCLDIRKYFPNTPSRRVFWFFHTILKCGRDVSALLARLATYNGHLPTGSPLSPIMAYFSYYDVWERIANICAQNSYTLTVYIDDVTISGARIDSRIIWDMKKIIHSSGIRYHKEKIFIDRIPEITGVIISGGKVLPPNRQMKKMSQMQRELRLAKSGHEEERLMVKFNGLFSQIGQIKSYK